MLVEEALIARVRFDQKQSNDLIRKKHYDKEVNTGNSYPNYSDLNEFISDKGIT